MFGFKNEQKSETQRERERERERGGWDGSRVCFVWGANREKWFLLARFSGTRDLNEFSSPHIVVCVCVCFFFFFLGDVLTAFGIPVCSDAMFISTQGWNGMDLLANYVA